MTWWTDPRHPELGDYWVSEELAVDPTWVPVPYGERLTREHVEAQVAAAFDVPVSIVRDALRFADTPPTGDAMPDSKRKAELDRRLAEGRCYWCGRSLDSDSPDAMFCSERHENEWRISTQVNANDYATVQARPDYAVHGRYDNSGGDCPTPEPGEDPPSWLGTPIRERIDPSPAFEAWEETADTHAETASFVSETAHARAPHSGQRRERTSYIPPSGPAFGGLQYLRMDTTDPDHLWSVDVFDPPPLTSAWDWTIHATNGAVPTAYGLESSALQPEGQVVASYSGDHTSQGFTLGPSYVYGHPALRELDRGPVADRTGWPLQTLCNMLADGWLPALAPDLRGSMLAQYQRQHPARDVLPTRRCEHCGEINLVAAHTADFAYPDPLWRFPENVDIYGAELDPPDPVHVERVFPLVSYRVTHPVCAGCMLPYPGPVAVPMVRQRQIGTWELAVATLQGVTGMSLTGEAATRDPRVVPLLWRDLYDQALISASPWRCVAPNCGCQALKWWALAAPMAWQGRTLRPQDQEPLVLGMCIQHHMDLYTQIHSQWDLHPRIRSMMLADHQRFVVD